MAGGNSARIARMAVSAPSVGRRMLYALLGFVAMAVALAGVWLPGLPTTPFVLVALWAFSRSSDRLAQWFLRVPVLRGAIELAERFRQERTLPLWVRLFAPAVAWSSTLFVYLTIGKPWVTLSVGAAAMFCLVFVLVTPTSRPAAELGS